MAERTRCPNCVGETRNQCDFFYERYVELQTSMMGSFEAQAEELAPRYPGVDPQESLLDAQREFTGWHQKNAIRYAQEKIGCVLKEPTIRKNFTVVTVERN